MELTLLIPTRCTPTMPTSLIHIHTLITILLTHQCHRPVGSCSPRLLMSQKTSMNQCLSRKIKPKTRQLRPWAEKTRVWDRNTKNTLKCPILLTLTATRLILSTTWCRRTDLHIQDKKSNHQTTNTTHRWCPTQCKCNIKEWCIHLHDQECMLTHLIPSQVFQNLVLKKKLTCQWSNSKKTANCWGTTSSTVMSTLLKICRWTPRQWPTPKKRETSRIMTAFAINLRSKNNLSNDLRQ